MRPSTVRSAEADLRIFAGFLIGHDPALSCAADIDRSHVEAFKLWQRAQLGQTGKPFKESSFQRRISLLKMFFIRIIEWEWSDAPARVPIFFGDVPKRDESLPKFLDDGDYAMFKRPTPRDRPCSDGWLLSYSPAWLFGSNPLPGSPLSGTIPQSIVVSPVTTAIDDPMPSPL